MERANDVEETDHSATPTTREEYSPEHTVPGVFVYTQREGTQLQVSFDVVGDFDILAAPAILELAYKVARARLGLD